MSGRAKKLRKQALALHPEGSTLETEVTKTRIFDIEGKPTPIAVATRVVYGGFRRAYKDLKRSHKHGEHI